MKKNKGWWTLLGFLLLAVGFLALVLSLVGIQFAFLAWMDAIGPLFGFVMRILMILGGVVIIYMAQSDFRGEKGVN